MDRKPAIAIAAAVVMGIGAAALAVAANIGGATARTPGTLGRDQSAVATTQTVAPTPKVVTVTVVDPPAKTATKPDDSASAEQEIVVTETVRATPTPNATTEPSDDSHETESGGFDD
jgi:hypothetical protein